MLGHLCWGHTLKFKRYVRILVELVSLFIFWWKPFVCCVVFCFVDPTIKQGWGAHTSHRLFSLLPHVNLYQSTKSRSKRLLNSFYPQTIRLLNNELSGHPDPLQPPSTHCLLSMYCPFTPTYMHITLTKLYPCRLRGFRYVYSPVIVLLFFKLFYFSLFSKYLNFLELRCWLRA